MEYILVGVNSSLYNTGKIMSCVNVIEDSVISTVRDIIESSVSVVYERVYYSILNEVSDSP